ncbi:Hypothetical predicted protein [Mytilus galloprovincialis]|uniref:Uncharacterized protein n=1 Tax=Mytilus galloprovincialis TaxID=29158 RepID=A0A8B6DA61_MYTGA|nr:Hypothetical predicted protein [Mytilus galloprovincialis]
MLGIKYLLKQAESLNDNSGVQSVSSEIDADSLVAWSSVDVKFRSNARIAPPFIGVFVSVAKYKYRDEHVEDILSDVVRELDTNPEYTYAFNYFRTPKIKSALTKKYFL